MYLRRALVSTSLVVFALLTGHAAEKTVLIQTGVRKASGEILMVGFLRVAGNPQRYDDRVLGVSGYLRVDDHEAFLFNSSEDLIQGRFENAFLLGWDPKTLPELGELCQRFDKKLIYVEGVFHAPNEGKSAVPYNGYIFQMNYVRLITIVPTTAHSEVQ